MRAIKTALDPLGILNPGSRALKMPSVNPPEAVVALTPRNPFERTPDGRPHVPDDLLERMLAITSEQAVGDPRPRGLQASSSKAAGPGPIPIASSSGVR